MIRRVGCLVRSVFRLKKLANDEKYYGRPFILEAVSGWCCEGCERRVECYKDKYKDGLSAVRQVGKVATSEMRVMSHRPMIGPCLERRFGSCVFCREMFYYCRNLYDENFFNELSRVHSVGSPCSLKSRVYSPKFTGDILYEGLRMHVVNEVDNPVCMMYDPVLDYDCVNNFNAYSKCTYVFSSVSKVLWHMYMAKIAIYDNSINKYYVNFFDTNYYQSDQYDIVFKGVRFKEIKESEMKIPMVRYCNIFIEQCEGYPLIDGLKIKECESSYVLNVCRYYGACYLYMDNKYYMVA